MEKKSCVCPLSRPSHTHTHAQNYIESENMFFWLKISVGISSLINTNVVVCLSIRRFWRAIFENPMEWAICTATPLIYELLQFESHMCALRLAVDDQSHWQVRENKKTHKHRESSLERHDNKLFVIINICGLDKHCLSAVMLFWNEALFY